MKKLVACVSQDNFSLSSEGEEEEEEGEEDEGEEGEEKEEEEEEEEELPVQGKLQLLEPERQEGAPMVSVRPNRALSPHTPDPR